MFNPRTRSIVLGSLAVCTALAAIVPVSSVHAAPSTIDVDLRNIEQQLVPKTLVTGDREFGGNGPKIVTTVNVSISEDRRKLKAKVFFHAKETKGDGSETNGEWKHVVYTAPAGRTIRAIVGAVEDGVVVPTAACEGSPAGSCVFSTTRFKSEKAGFQLLGPTADWVTFLGKLKQIVEKVIQAENQLNDRDTPTQEERQAQEILTMLEQGAAFLPSEENHVHLRTSDNDGPVRVFAIVGDTGGADISNDDDGKDDTRINAIMFKRLRIALD